MKILLDMNMPQIWCPYLIDAEHEAIHWRDVGDIRAPDTEIMEWARRNGQVVMTHDLDFGALLYTTNASAPSVVQIRAEHIIPRVVGPAVIEALESTREGLSAGALVTIDPRRHRIRLLPFRRGASG